MPDLSPPFHAGRDLITFRTRCAARPSDGGPADRDGARVMVCGGRDMATGVVDALAEILAPTRFTPAVLKAEGRYVEDVY